jgi:hypothetical protein
VPFPIFGFKAGLQFHFERISHHDLLSSDHTKHRLLRQP